MDARRSQLEVPRLGILAQYHLTCIPFIENIIRIWDVGTRALQQMLTGHDDRVSPTEFTSSGQCLVSSSYDRTIRIWNAETEALQQTLMVGPRLWHSHLIIRISHFHHRTAQSGCVMWQQELWKRLGATIAASIP